MRFLFPRCDWPLRAFHPLSLLSFLFFLFFSRSRRDKARKEVRTSAPGCFHRRMGARLCPQAKTFVDLRLDRRDFEAISRYPVCVLFFFFSSPFTYSTMGSPEGFHDNANSWRWSTFSSTCDRYQPIIPDFKRNFCMADRSQRIIKIMRYTKWFNGIQDFGP